MVGRVVFVGINANRQKNRTLVGRFGRNHRSVRNSWKRRALADDLNIALGKPVKTGGIEAAPEVNRLSA